MASQGISLQFRTFERLQRYLRKNKCNSMTEAIEKLLDEVKSN